MSTHSLSYHLLILPPQAIEDAVAHLAPRMTTNTGTKLQTDFMGWSRMAVPIEGFQLQTVTKPGLGKEWPATVEADIAFSVYKYAPEIRTAWDALRPNDELYLLSIQAPASLSQEKWSGGRDGGVDANGLSFCEFYGVRHVRGCEIVEFVGEDGKLLADENEKPLIEEDRAPAKSGHRTVRVRFDSAQYQRDQWSTGGSKSDIYSSFNVLLRRRPGSDNTGKAMTTALLDLLATSDGGQSAVPTWLTGLILGYGDPMAAHHSRMMASTPLVESQFHDALLDEEHVLSSFPRDTVKFVESPAAELRRETITNSVVELLCAPDSRMDAKRKLFIAATTRRDTDKLPTAQKPKKLTSAGEGDGKMSVNYAFRASVPAFAGPYAEDVPARNLLRFVPNQIEAIRAATLPGLTLIEGLPETGKTAVAAQVLCNLYHAFPDQRTLVIARDDLSLNQLFAHLHQLDVDSSRLVRLGQSSTLPSHIGGQASFLERRIELLVEVDRLARTCAFNTAGDVAISCETASNFFNYHVRGRFQEFMNKWSTSIGDNDEDPAAGNVIANSIANDFPFTPFFANAPGVVSAGGRLFPDGISSVQALEIARGCWRHVEKMFGKLEEIRAFELVRSGHDRANFLLAIEAAIVGMTCNHAVTKVHQSTCLTFVTSLKLAFLKI